MQRFVEADYYELDWYYEECSDGKTVQEKSWGREGAEGWGEIPVGIKHF